MSTCRNNLRRKLETMTDSELVLIRVHWAQGTLDARFDESITHWGRRLTYEAVGDLTEDILTQRRRRRQ